MKFAVPTYSQFFDVKDPLWRPNSCGIVALKMLMDFCGVSPVPTTEALIQEGVSLGAYDPKTGWIHAGLVKLAQKHGLQAQNLDWAAESQDVAASLLARYLQKGPVIASVFPKLRPGAPGGHLVVVTGLEKGMITINDPEKKTRSAIEQALPLEKFLAGWKRRIIVIEPRAVA